MEVKKALIPVELILGDGIMVSIQSYSDLFRAGHQLFPPPHKTAIILSE